MPKPLTAAERAICKVVAHILPGQVMSYGEVARKAGYPRHARHISKAMSRSPEKLPWHRVIRSDHRLAFDINSEMHQKQRALLQKEGIYIIDGKVQRPDSAEAPDLDKLLWGPPQT